MDPESGGSGLRAPHDIGGEAGRVVDGLSADAAAAGLVPGIVTASRSGWLQ